MNIFFSAMRIAVLASVDVMHSFFRLVRRCTASPLCGKSRRSSGRRKCCLGALEVKCPYSGREEKIKPGKNFPFLEERDGNFCLKRGHNYYYQCMGQMAICKKHRCYFVTYTFCDILIEKIAFDETFYATMLPLLEDFYTKHYLPTIVSTL